MIAAVPAPPPAAGAAAPPLLSIDGLTLAFGEFRAVRNLNLSIAPGEVLALVGESGSGKSVSCLAITRLLEASGGHIVSGRMDYRDRAGNLHDLAAATQARMRGLRGPEIAMIFQDPMSSLNPVLRIGQQIMDAILLHRGGAKAAARAEAVRLLDRVRIAGAARQLQRYPFELSGGMRQRVMIAMALSCQPRLLIADEPTTALDVTVQAQVLRLLRSLQLQDELALLFVTHDMGVVAEIADRVAVMQNGELVEQGDVHRVFRSPEHAYTRALLAAVPVLGALAGSPLPRAFDIPGQAALPPQDAPDARAEPLLRVEQLSTRFTMDRGFFGQVKSRIHAVEKISFDIQPGETLALVGESGCGKSTTGRSLIRLEQPSAGSIAFGGEDITQLDAGKESRLRRGVQYIFQDPYASLNPRITVGRSISEPIRTHALQHGAAVDAAVDELLDQVGLLPQHAQRYPHELSGGQRQRVCIARAIASQPRLIIADEAVAALDVTTRAQVLNLMLRLQRERGLAYLFISHDMAVVERVSHRVAVMYLGQIVEIGPRQAVMNHPQHPYTRRLLAAVPIADPALRNRERDLDDAEVPDPRRLAGDEPVAEPLVAVGDGHFVARHRVGGLY
jgi:glutathione transport system ATP-binding protein